MKKISTLKSAQRVLIAIAAVLGATVLRTSINSIAGDRYPLLFYTAAIVVAALFGGFRAGVLATVLSAVAADFLFVEPRWTLALKSPGDLLVIGAFVLLGLFLSLLIGRLHEAREGVYFSALAVKASEAKLSALADAVPEILFTATGEGTTDYVSKRFSDYSGIDPGQLLATGWLNVLHPEDRERTIATWSRCTQTGIEYEMTYRMRRSDGEYRWFQCRATPLRDTTGRISKWFGVCTDIDDHKRLEDQLAERTDALVRTNEELQRFAFAASHDLQTPLRMMTSYCEQLLNRDGKVLDSEASECISHVLSGIDQMRRRVRDMLEYASASHDREIRTRTDLNAMLQLVLAQLQPWISETGATVTFDPLPTVIANDSRILQVLQNLIGNAIKYRATEPLRVHVSARLNGDEWLFSVSDNGLGFDMKYAERIFGVFQRLHSNDKIEGTGIGLAIVKRIIERHQGRVWAESAPGKGATFYFTLPARIDKLNVETQSDVLRNP